MPMSPRLLRPIASRSLVDADATAYLTAVQAADGQALEPAVRDAITAFVIGCKADGIWNALEASCILCGARTLAGALTPLRGPAPTNSNFVATDYSRKDGLTGDASTKRIQLNRQIQETPSGDTHISFFINNGSSTTFQGQMGTTNAGADTIQVFSSNNTFSFCRLRNSTNFTAPSGTGSPNGTLFAMTRNDTANITYRARGGSQIVAAATQALSINHQIFVFWGGGNWANWTLGFYSHGRHLNVAALDSRVTALCNAISAAIP